MAQPKLYHYETNCTQCESDDVHAMLDMAVEVSYATVQQHCAGLDDWAQQMGYHHNGRFGLTLKADWHVGFYRSVFLGRRCYIVRHSAIEHIWVKDTHDEQKEPCG